ncbi:MAG: hypothetical protein ACK5MN_03275 [Lachnospiraceae bacterium]
MSELNTKYAVPPIGVIDCKSKDVVTDADVRELFDLCMKAQNGTGNHVAFNMSNHPDCVAIYVMLGGFDEEKEYDAFFLIFRNSVAEYLSAAQYLSGMLEGADD